jgi:hypothetical protein
MLPSDLDLDPRSLDAPPSKAAIRAAGRRCYDAFMAAGRDKLWPAWDAIGEAEQLRWFAAGHAVLVPERRS